MSISRSRTDVADRRVLEAVCMLPLASAGDIADHLGLVYSSVSRRLTRLEEKRLLVSLVSGAALRPARRYRLLPSGARFFLEPEVHFHVTRRLNSLACFMPGLEWFYRVSARLPELCGVGRLQSFHWRFRDGVDAMVRYEAGTVAFFWSGPWQTSTALRKRLDDLGRASSALGGWPALVCVVAADFWQACRASGVLAEYGVAERSLVFCAETGMVTGGGAAAEGRHLLISPILGARSHVLPVAEPRLLRGVRGGLDAYLWYRLMYLVEQFPGARAGSLTRALGTRSKWVLGKLERLVEDGYLLDVDGYHYLGDASLKVSAQRDRVHLARPGRRFGVRSAGVPAAFRHRQHDAAAFGVVSVWRSGGFPVAGGWRGDDYSGGRDAVAPDGMVYVGEGSSGGAGWRYFEYERRADSARGVAGKLRGYLSRGAGFGDFPIFVAARNRGVAQEFRRQAAAAGHMLWAAAIPDLEVDDSGTVWGPETAWMDYSGSAAALFPPFSERTL